MESKASQEEANEILRTLLKAMPYEEEPSPESLRAALLDFCASKIDAELRHLRAGQGLAITVFVETVNPDFTFESENPRNSIAAQEWRKAVYERDGYACRDCGAKGDIQAHHIEEWAVAPAKRYDVDNGLTLCIDHHAARHPRHAHLIKYGKIHSA